MISLFKKKAPVVAPVTPVQIVRAPQPPTRRRINQKSLMTLKIWEGKVGSGGRPMLTAYLDSGGVWTIGWGHTKTARQGMMITEDQAEALLAADLFEFETLVEQYVKVALTDNQFGALVLFAFNVGPGSESRKIDGFKTSTLLKQLNLGGYEQVPTQLLRWVKDNGKVVQGLINRRNAEIALWHSLT